VYSVLDWRDPGLTLGVAAGAAVGIVLVHCLFYGLHLWRVHLHRKYFKGRADEGHVDDSHVEFDQF